MSWRFVNSFNAVLGLIYGVACGLLFLLQSLQWHLGWSAAPVLVLSILLIAGAAGVLRRQRWGDRVLAGGWGAMFGSFAATYFASDLNRAVDSSWAEGSYSIVPGPLLGALLLSNPAVSFLGLIVAIAGKGEP